jgi:hypothetical protein
MVSGGCEVLVITKEVLLAGLKDRWLNTPEMCKYQFKRWASEMLSKAHALTTTALAGDGIDTCKSSCIDARDAASLFGSRALQHAHQFMIQCFDQVVRTP